MSLKIGIGLFTGQIPSSVDKTFYDEYRDSLELVRLAEYQGFDSAWVSEHHFSGDGYLPSLLPLLAAFAAVTSKVELGTAVVLAPFHDPIRLAEDFAVVDQLSGGRVICGLGLGWRDEEFRAFGIDPSTKVRRLREVVEVLRLAWNEERFSYEGRHYSYKDVAVTPKPARVPQILIGGFADPAVKRAGRIGDGYISSRAQLDRVVETFKIAAEARAEAGKAGEPIVGLLQNCFVTENPERDWRQVHAGIGHQLGVYAGWRAGTDVAGSPLEVMPPPEDTIRSTTAFGTPEEVRAALEPVAHALGKYDDAHLVLRFYYPGMSADTAARAVRLFASEVLPALRDAGTRA